MMKLYLMSKVRKLELKANLKLDGSAKKLPMNMVELMLM
jgi:hypothetical protein